MTSKTETNDSQTARLPSPIKAVCESWPESISQHSHCTLFYEVRWELPRYVKEHLTAGQSIRDIMTITGTLQDAQATTCQEYMSKTWPDVHEILLEGIEKLVSEDSNACELCDVLRRHP